MHLTAQKKCQISNYNNHDKIISYCKINSELMPKMTATTTFKE